MTLRSAGLVLLLALLWGPSYPLLTLAVQTIPPVTVIAVRALGGALILLAALGPGVRDLWRVAREGHGLWVQSMFNCIVPWGLVTWAARVIDTSLMTILNSLSPIFIFLLTWGITRHEVASPRKFLGVVLGLAGVVTIVGIDALSGVGTHTLAELACVAGSLAYAVAAVVGVRYQNVSPLVPAAGSVVIAALVMVPIALLVDPWPVRPSLASALALAGLCIFPTGLALVVYFRLLATIGAIATSSQAYLRILVGVGSGVLLLGDQLGASMIAGLVLVVAGVIAMTLPDRRSPEPPRSGRGPT